MPYQSLTDKELIDLLFAESDRLPRAAVNECVRRRDRIVGLLAEIVSQEECWAEQGPEGWAVLHATYILGAIATDVTVDPLLKALLFATDKEYSSDWIAESLSSIFAKVGIPALEGLKEIATDRSQEWYPRVRAIGCLAAITLANPEVEDEVFALLGSIFTDEEESWDVRQSTGNTLLDFRKEEYREALLAFGEKESELGKQGFFYVASFHEDDVKRAFQSHGKKLRDYTDDWLSFYNEDQIAKRQERWKNEEKMRLKQEQKERERVYYSGAKPFVREMPKVGRNEPCPCGSGKKYKKCCG